MRRRYNDCQRADGNCALCVLARMGRDCHDRPIAKLTLARMRAGMTQPELAQESGVNIRQLARVEGGESDAGNLSGRNLLAIADALDVDPHDLI